MGDCHTTVGPKDEKESGRGGLGRSCIIGRGPSSKKDTYWGEGKKNGVKVTKKKTSRLNDAKGSERV